MLTRTKAIVKNIIGEKNLGRWDYLLKPQLADRWGGPFNGQAHRQRIFEELIERLPIKVIVETGTYLGTTTEFLAEAGVPVYTVESNPRFYAYAVWRFYHQRDKVHLYEGDSVAFIRDLANLKDFPMCKVFFYLDAHWEDRLPLREELEIIFSKWSEVVVMIDDFEVPGTEYGFDDYGPGKVLSLKYLEPLEHLGLSFFFPSVDPNQETGMKRGCVVLCREQCMTKLLNGIDSLVPTTKI